MTQPPSPLAALLEPLTAIRQALAYVPRILEAGDPLYALEVVEEQRVQLAEWLDELERYAEAEGPFQARLDQELAGSTRVISSAAADDLPGVKPPPRSGLAALGRSNPDDGFADVPLF